MSEPRKKGGPPIVWPDSEIHKQWRAASKRYYWKKKRERLLERQRKLEENEIINGEKEKSET